MTNKYGLVTERKNPDSSVRSSQPGEKSVEALIQQLGKVDEKTDLNPRISAGFPFFGQLLGHDITDDSGLSNEPLNEEPGKNSLLKNGRSPALDLDCLYGSGLFEKSELCDQGKFKLNEVNEFDLPRDQKDVAVIGDPRSDRNLILAQLHLAFLKFHNAIYDRVNDIKDEYVKTDAQGNRVDENPLEKTQRLVRWHYQWIILSEFLPLLVGSKMVLNVLTRGPQWYKPEPEVLFVPLEFSVAAYRSGHSQIHYRYRINDALRLPLFSAKNSPGQRPDQRRDLQGGLVQGGPIKNEHFVDWKYFFDRRVKPASNLSHASKAIKPRMAGTLLFPPPALISNRQDKRNQNPEPDSLAKKALALRDLERGDKRGLPSGQDVAGVMKDAGIPITVCKELKGCFDDELNSLPSDLQQQTPLWYYILKEAEVQYEGKMLGDVGGRIVAEVIIGLLQADPSSFWEKVNLVHLYEVLRNDKRLNDKKGDVEVLTLKDQETLREKGGNWKPALPIQRGSDLTKGDFTIVDLLEFAGVWTR